MQDYLKLTSLQQNTFTTSETLCNLIHITLKQFYFKKYSHGFTALQLTTMLIYLSNKHSQGMKH